MEENNYTPQTLDEMHFQRGKFMLKLTQINAQISTDLAGTIDDNTKLQRL